MAYIVDSKTNNTGGVADDNLSVELPAYQADDWLYLFSNWGNGTLVTGPSGWTLLYDLNSSSGVRSVAWRKKATASEIDPLVVISTALTISLCIVSVRDADPTTPEDVAIQTDVATSGVTLHTYPAITPVNNGSLILDVMALGTTPQPLHFPESPIRQPVSIANSDRGLYVHAFGQETAATIPSYDINGSSNTRHVMARIAIRNATGGKVAPIATGGRLSIVRGGGADPITPVDISTIRTSFAGVNTDALTTLSANNAASVGSTQFWAQGTTVTVAPPNNGLRWYGFYFATPASSDLSGPISMGFGTNLVKANADLNTISLYFEDSAGNWVLKNVGQKSTTSVLYFKVNDYTTTDSSGTIDLTDINRVGVCWQRLGTGTNGKQVHISGLSSNSPMILSGFVRPRTVSRYLRALGINARASSSGELQEVIYTDFQIGNGTSYTEFSAIASSTEFPFGVANYGVSQYENTITIKASATDLIDLRQGIFSSSTPQQFTIDSASSTSATYLTAGLIIRGFRPTWKTGVRCRQISFIKCDTIDAKAAQVELCVVEGSIATTAAMIVNAGVSVTGCEFTKSSETYALQIQDAGTYDLTGTTFTGYTTPLYISAVSGTVDITYDGTPPAYVSDGATVNFIAGATIALSGLKVNSEVRYYDAGTTTELAGVENSGTSFSAAVTVSAIDIVILHVNYLPIRLTNVPASVDTTIPIQQIFDRNYSNP